MSKTDHFSINYSVATVFNGGGIGYTAYNAVLGIYLRGWLKRLFTSSYKPSEINPKLITSLGFSGRWLRRFASYNPSFGYYFHDIVFDRFVSTSLEEASLFHGWNQHCLLSLQKAKFQGAVTIVERASSHLLSAQKIIEKEYRKYDSHISAIDGRSLKRGLKEYEETDFVLVPSQFAYQSFLDQGFPKAKLKKIAYGVDLERFKPVKKSVPNQVFTFLFMGQVGLRKGIPYLLEAWRRAEFKNCRLLLAGALQPDIKPYLAKRGLPTNVVIQYFEEPTKAYEQADVFVFPSVEEGMALVTLEAQACGLPVITTYNSGSLVEDNSDGFLVEAGNEQKLAEKMLELYEDSQKRVKFSLNARKKAELHSWDQYREHLLNFYIEITKNGKGK